MVLESNLKVPGAQDCQCLVTWSKPPYDVIVKFNGSPQLPEQAGIDRVQTWMQKFEFYDHQLAIQFEAVVVSSSKEDFDIQIMVDTGIWSPCPGPSIELQLEAEVKLERYYAVLLVIEVAVI